MFWTDIGIWKVTIERILGVDLSKIKAIRRESVGSMAPNVESKAFLYLGHDCNTSKIDIAARD